jgi:hypothetical protein
MVRTQIQLTQEQAERLKEKAAETGVSMAELIRRSIDSYLNKDHTLTRAERLRRVEAIIGKYADEADDVAVNHDRYLADIYAEEHSRESAKVA